MTTSAPSSHVERRSRCETSVVRVDGQREIAYAEYGRPSGTPLVFLHGTPGSRRLGALFDRAARTHGVRVLAPDRPGYGRSSPWPGRSVADAAAFVTPVLDDADVDAARLAGFSGGGPYALSTAATRPDRVDGVDVIAGATPPTVGGDAPAVQRLIATLATRAPRVLGGLLRGQAWCAERLDPSFVVGQYTASNATDPVPDRVAETVRADFLEAFAHGRSGAVTEFRTTSTDWGVDIAAIETDVDLWYGTADTNVPFDHARGLERAIPTAELHALDGADHLRTLVRSVPEVLTAGR